VLRKMRIRKMMRIDLPRVPRDCLEAACLWRKGRAVMVEKVNAGIRY
jgi:hypothetical protein